MSALDAFRDYVQRHPINTDVNEYETYYSLFSAAVIESKMETREYLWELLNSNKKWKRIAIALLMDNKFDKELMDDEYLRIERMLDDEDVYFRGELAKLLGRTRRWPNPLLMRLATKESEAIRSGMIGFLLSAAGIKPMIGIKMAQSLSKTPGLVSEKMIMDAIKSAQQGKTKN